MPAEVSVWAGLAGAAAGLAVLLFCRVPFRVRRTVSLRRFGSALLVVGAVAGWLLWPISGARLALVVILGMATLPVVGLLRRRRASRIAIAVSDRVIETTESLAAELTVGLPPGQALIRACESWPVLSSVVEAERLGADVPTAWRALAELDGARELRLVGAAWEVAIRTGGGLAEAMTRVAETVRANRATARIVGAELASARATARLVAALPLAALAMGTSEDAQPIAFLLTEPVGLACLAAGLAFGLGGLWWIEAIAAGVER